MKKHTCEMKTEYTIKNPTVFNFLYTKLARYYDGWSYSNEVYCELQDNVFPIHDIEICSY